MAPQTLEEEAMAYIHTYALAPAASEPALPHAAAPIPTGAMVVSSSMAHAPAGDSFSSLHTTHTEDGAAISLRSMAVPPPQPPQPPQLDEVARLPIHLRGRLPAPPPERGAAFLGDYGLKAKPASMPPKRQDMLDARRVSQLARSPAKPALSAEAIAVAGGGERKRVGEREENAPPRQPHAGEEGKKVAAEAIEALAEQLRELEPER